MSPMASSMAICAFGLIPSGFSFEASFTISAWFKPISRASSAIGLPPWYGAMARIWLGANGLFIRFCNDALQAKN